MKEKLGLGLSALLLLLSLVFFIGPQKLTGATVSISPVQSTMLGFGLIIVSLFLVGFIYFFSRFKGEK